MALAGHDTPIAVFSDSTTSTTYSGSITVASGELIDVVIAADGNNNAQDPSAWTVTLDGVAMSHVNSSTTSLTEAFGAYFSLETASSGSVTLSVTTVNATRAMAANAFRITGHDTTTPHPNSGNSQPGSSSTSLTVPSAITTSADGNAIIGGIGVHGGDITGLAVAVADGSSTGKTGTNAFSDVTWGVAWDETPTAASVSFAWSWTGSDRPGAVWAEVAVAAGSGGQTITGAAFTDTDNFGAGTVSTSYTITGAAYSDTDSFGSGTITQGLTISGAAFTDADSFGAGTVTTSYTITGAAFSDGDSFGSGTVTQGTTITGAAFSDADTFGAGTISTSYTITGAAFEDADTFGAGAVSFDQVITGAVFSNVSAFGFGTVSYGTPSERRSAYPGIHSGGVVTTAKTGGALVNPGRSGSIVRG